MKKTYFEVETSLKKLYPQELKGYAKQRMNHLIVYITSLITEYRSSMSGLSSSSLADIEAASHEKQAKRFLEHKDTRYEVHYLPMLRVFLSQILSKVTLQDGIRLVIDGSSVNSAHVGLMISLVVGKRSIPLGWVIRSGKKGHFPTDMHLEVLKKVGFFIQEMLLSCQKTELPVTLLGDGEFDSIDLQVYCQDQFGWKYIFRTASNVVIHERGDRFQAHEIVADPEEDFVFLENIEFTEKRYRYVHFLYWHDPQKYEDPIYLVTNWKDPLLIKTFYQQRFSIETMFKDFKTRGFNMHKSRLRSIHALTNLLMLVSIAFCLLMNFGNLNADSPLKSKVQRVRKPTEKDPFSVFSFAKNLLKYCLKREIPFSLEWDLLRI